jgi:protein TonB
MFPQRNITWSAPAGGGLKSRLPGLAITVGLHAAVILAVLSYAPARQTLAELAPIMVSLVQPKAAEPPKEPPKPRPVVKQPPKRIEPKPLPLLTATAPEVPAPAAIQPPPAPPAPPEPIAAKPAPAAVIPPQFNADYLNNPAPAYPALSRRLGEEGRVVLRVFVDERGLPARVEMRASSGHERLDNVALDTVRQWKFVPARRGDQAVSAWVLVPISFSLRS